MKTPFYVCTLILGIWLMGITPLKAQKQLEKLDRGLVAVHADAGRNFLSWRLLASDSTVSSFNVYGRHSSEEKWQRLNKSPIERSTDFVDSSLLGKHAMSLYGIKKVINGKEGAIEVSNLSNAGTWGSNYLTIPLKTPQGYQPNDISVGDLDGDGRYELIVHMTGRSKDNSQSGFTDPPILEAYRMDGRLLWRINLGTNIREGAHYTQFMVYDLDGDGRAEVACKTADGTVDGQGKGIGDSTHYYVGSDGRIISGPEYLTVFNGLTGAAISTVNYIPARGDVEKWGGHGGSGGYDDYGNRVDRFLACIAYLDGIHPSLVMCRGYYGRSVLAAWDYQSHELKSRWVFDSKDSSNAYSGQGNHNLTVADVDHDGKDEIVYGSMCVDDNGKGLYTTGLRHGDAVHVSDLDPDHPGMEVFGIHEIEDKTSGPGMALYDAKTGEILWTADKNQDVGRGLAADIDPRYPGTEVWGGQEGLMSIKGQVIGQPPKFCNFAIWWDGDLLRELLNGTRITKWDWKSQQEMPLLDAAGCLSNNGTKANPALSADLFGDWREEVVFRTKDNESLRIYTTTIPTNYRFITLMQNLQYRLSVAWQNVGYNQPPYTDFFLGDGMVKPSR